jgi:hypothetical protein
MPTVLLGRQVTDLILAISWTHYWPWNVYAGSEAFVIDQRSEARSLACEALSNDERTCRQGELGPAQEPEDGLVAELELWAEPPEIYMGPTRADMRQGSEVFHIEALRLKN